MPYIYSLAGKAYHNDYTIMRALIMDFGEDNNVLNIGDQYMFGPSIMVSPVYTYKAREREVYLPAGSGWYNFNTGEYFTGIVGEGAWLNGQKISVSQVDDKEKAILATGFPSRTDFSDEAMESVIKDLQTYKKIRMIGSAAMAICYVACGRVEAYYEKGIMLWDIAGGIPVVLGAGGQSDIEKVSPAGSYNILMSNGKLT